MTQDGRAFLEPCQRILEESERAFRNLDSVQRSPEGTIRLTLSYNLALSFVIDRLAKFRTIHPRIELDVVVEDAFLNVIEERIDVALRTGWNTDSGLYAVTLASFRMILCLAPALLADHAPPKRPDDLLTVPWISSTNLANPDRLVLAHGSGQRRTIKLVPAIKTNSGIATRAFVERGAGLGLLPDYAAAEGLASGALIHVLPDWRVRDGAIVAVFPHRSPMPRRTRVLIDFLKAEFKQRPW
ncbi:MAG: LysR substrate-binding domain-containing protein [Alphaproteobacteria bacterium]